MSKTDNYKVLKKYCLSQGIDLFGVADIREIKNEIKISQQALEGLDNAVSLGVRLSESVLREIVTQPTKLYFHHYRTANAFLDQAAFKVVQYIQRKGFSALPVPASQILDWQNQTAHLSHKKIGYLAGLGWIGRNNLLVNKKAGSKFRLSTVLTDMPLKQDKPLKDDCGECVACLKACPSAAIKENPADFDHMACFAALKELQRRKIVDQYICGVCVNVCAGKK